LAQIDLVNGPEASHLVLVHLPDVLVLDGEDHEAIGVLFEEGLWEGLLRHVLALTGLGDRLVGNDLGISTAISAVVLVEELGAGHLGWGFDSLREFLGD
jgi:hypothetical protein